MRYTKWIRLEGREKRHLRIRKKISGTASVPRLSIFRSLTNLYVQLIDDENGKTLFSISTQHPHLKAKTPSGGNVTAAGALGTELAKSAVEKGIKKVVFDRSGYKYSGRIKALADAARKGGLEF